MMRTFKEYENYDTTVAHIIDAFECTMQKPSDDEAAAPCFSNYKHNYTAKFLLDILSNGAFYFISDAYGGSITDPDLTRVCGFLQLMISGLDVMADKGFLLQDDLQELGCLCHIPPVRRRGQEQCTAEESETTHHIANRRIYVENGGTLAGLNAALTRTCALSPPIYFETLRPLPTDLLRDSAPSPLPSSSCTFETRV